MGALLALPLLQLVPLPPSLWTIFPGRPALAGAFAAAAEPLPWLPLSMTPGATERFFFSFLPAASLIWALGDLGEHARRRIVWVAVVLGLFSVALGFAQLAGGQNSPLRFYSADSDAVGFFANRNHYAASLYMLIPLATAAISGSATSWRTNIACVLIALPLLLGVMLSGSRAGWALGSLSAVGSLIIVMSARPARPGIPGTRPYLLAAAAAFVFLIAMAVLAIGMMPRLQDSGLASDLRWPIASTTWTAIKAYFPVGSGFGSFQQVYAIVEKPEDVMAAMVNNAHDDWLEIVVEAGLPGALVAGAALVWLLRATILSLSASSHSVHLIRTNRATLLVFWLVALHSLVEYPLRTIAVNIIFALSAGLRAQAAHAKSAARHVHSKAKWDLATAPSPGRRSGAAR